MLFVEEFFSWLFHSTLKLLNFLILFIWIYRYVWEHLEVGYVQGMCDLVAPLLVIFDDGKIWTNVLFWLKI